tara:strand:- start:290 stop:1243 length:954 start_codon:yes stop_codon:yes gene_type:complete
MNLKNLKKLSGDASFRSFYRKKNYKHSSIIVFCKKQKKSNLVIYEAINNLLIKKNLSAPKMINYNYKKNYLEMEDFGDLTVLKLLRRKKEKKLIYYKSIILLLKKIQKIKTKKIKTFLKTEYRIPNYTKEKLFNEANLFLQWYFPKFIKGKRKNIEKRKISKIFKNLLNRLLYKKKVFIHRDFHISNIMITKQGLGLIDSQDATFGNIAYDLASLIDDVRFKTDKLLKEKILNQFIKNNSSLNKNKFINDFEILSVLRNFKIIGIFSRLSKRDKKHNYLKLIPHAWQLIEDRINNNNKFKDLKNIIDKNFPKKIRKK